MTKGEKVFNVVVSVAVVLTGAGFGAFAGLIYSEGYWWAGMLAGGVSAFSLAKVFLRRLKDMSAKGDDKKSMCLRSTFVAVICGAICAAIVHAALIVIVMVYPPIHDETLPHLIGFPIMMSIGVAVGAVAGMVVGAICSLVYVLAIKGN